MRAGIEPPLIGRDRELAVIRECLAGAASGGRCAILLEGEAGIGKTRLLNEVASDAERSGFKVFRAAADEIEQARSFGLLIDALGLTPVAPPTALDRPANAADRRLAVADEVVALIERATEAGPVALIVDDLHWADAESLMVFRALLRRTRTLPFLLAAASRPSPSNAELERLIEAVEGVGGSHATLDPLGDEDVTKLMTGLLAESITPALRDRISSAGGNPFFVIEILAAGLDELVESGLPSDLRRTVLRRLAHLSDGARTVVSLASLLGPAIDVAELEVVAGRSSIDLLPTLTEAVKSQVLVDRDGTLSFRHDIIRDAVYTDIPIGVRRRMHVEAARALASSGAPLRRVAEHFARGAERGDREAIAWLRRAAAAELRRAPGVTADLLDRAGALVELSDPERADIDAERAHALARAGRVDEAFVLASDVLSRPGAARLSVDVRIALGEAAFFLGRVAQGAEQLEMAATEAPDPRRPLLLAQAALGRLQSGDLHAAATHVEHALALEASAPDARARSLATAICGAVEGLRGDYSALELLREAARIADEDASGAAQTYGANLYLGMGLTEVGHLDESVEVLRRGLSIDEAGGTVWALPSYHGALGACLYRRGEWDDAVAELDTAMSLLDDTGSCLLRPYFLGHLAQVAIHRGDFEAGERYVAMGEADLAHGPQSGAEWLVVARIILTQARGEGELALTLTRSAWQVAEAMGITAAFRHLGPFYVSLAVDHGAADEARAAAAAVEELALTAITPPAAGAALLCRGTVERDTSVLLQAVDTLREAGHPLDVAVACEQAARIIGKTDAARGHALLEEAISGYEALGAVWDAERASGHAKEVSGRRRARKRKPVTGWESLSPTERRVVDLVTQGLTNAAIAERLVVSRRTVETHLTHLFRKLGISSRLELGVRAARELD